MKGKIIQLDSGVSVVPFEQCEGGYTCVVVYSSHERYPVGGYNIFVTDEELNGGVVFDFTIKCSFEECKNDMDRVAIYLLSRNNEPATRKEILEGTKISESSLSQILHITNKHYFISVPIPGYSRNRKWALTEERAKKTWSQIQ